ncbi:MAG: hypothetical protein NXH87_11845 [Rhodobiaceae bacterium]|nr:hypothetical protein [Rhodobiaceae bacterium]
MILWLFGFADIVLFAVFCTAILMLQGLWSVTLKSLGYGEASLLLDFGFWGVLSLGVLTAYLFSASDIQRMQTANAVLAVYFLSLYAWTVWKFRAAPPGLFADYKSTILGGMPLMAVGVLALLATTSGRLGIGLLSSVEMTADYSILFRATALPIVVHQLIVVAKFRRVFDLPVGDLQKLLPVIITLVALSVGGFWVLADWLGFLLGPAFVKTFAAHRVEGLLILSQSVLWSAIALNDLVNNRSQTSKQAAWAAALYIAVALLGGWWFLSGAPVTLALFVPVHSLVMLGYLVVQIVVMRLCGIQLWRMWLLALASFVSFSLAAFAGLL